MGTKNNNRSVVLAIQDKEMDTTNKYTRGNVEYEITLAIKFAVRLKPNDQKKKKMLSRWPENCSVHYKWVESVISKAKVNFKPKVYIPENYYDKLFNILVNWLDLVDSVLDRKLIILAACDISMNRIGNMLGILRQTASRRHTRALDTVVWKLNHLS